MDPVTITFATASSPESAAGRSFTAFADAVKEKSDGKITFEPYWSGSLLQTPEALDGVKSGTADSATLVPTYFPQELPVNVWFSNLSFMPKSSLPHGLVSGSAAVMQTQTTEDAMKAELEAQGLKLLMATQNTVAMPIICTKPVETLEDADGLRVRVGGPPWSDELEALGMVPTVIPMDEAYQALQRGLVDCAVAPETISVAFGLWEVAKHHVPLTMSGNNSTLQVMNMDTWNKLPTEAQEVITESAHTFFTAEAQDYLSDYEAWAVDAGPEHDVEFHDASELNAVLDTYHEDLTQTLVDDAAGFVEAYQSALDTWYDDALTDLGPKEDLSAGLDSFDFSSWDARTEELFATQGE